VTGTPVHKILQITDLHILPEETASLQGVNPEYHFRLLLRHANHEHGPFDLIIASGDLADQGDKAAYQRILLQLQKLDTPVMCLPGNHDTLAIMQSVFNQAKINCQRYRVLKHWQIIGLNSAVINSPDGNLADAELEFLEERLKLLPKMPSLIAVHHPCINIATPWLDSMQIKNSAALLTLLNRYDNAKAITFGHVHMELAQQIGKLGIYASPAGCFQFTPQSSEYAIDQKPPGYRVFELSSDALFNTSCHYIC
jgi:3',5'-cyclic-AMP phosphodiesterase